MICTACNNEKFYEYAMYKVVEEVRLLKVGGVVKVEVDELYSVEPLENFNEFKCTRCGKVYTIGKDNGEEVLVLLE